MILFLLHKSIWYKGELPLDKTIEVSVGINLLNTVLTAAVKGWTEGSGEGEVGIY